MYVYRLADGEMWPILQTQDICPLHVDTSPKDPELIRYALDMPDAHGQRCWSIRLDGSDRHPIRRQEFGEMVTHEFWWADPDYIGYTYQDRREDPDAPHPPLGGIRAGADAAGASPTSPVKRCISPTRSTATIRTCIGRTTAASSAAKGTHDHSFVYAARFSMGETKLEMTPMATIHTEYVPFRGQGVDCNFSADSRWLIYADKLDPEGPHQLFAVQVDL